MEVREGPLSAVVIGEVERRRLADTGGLRLPSFLRTKMLHGVPRGTAGAGGPPADVLATLIGTSGAVMFPINYLNLIHLITL